MNNCGTCKWWRGDLSNVANGEIQGACHAVPPTPVVIHTPQGVQITSQMPMTRRSHFCGAWKLNVIEGRDDH